jgi:hypothetical protein
MGGGIPPRPSFPPERTFGVTQSAFKNKGKRRSWKTAALQEEVGRLRSRRLKFVGAIEAPVGALPLWPSVPNTTTFAVFLRKKSEPVAAACHPSLPCWSCKKTGTHATPF